MVTQHSYTRTAIALHWLAALLIVSNLALGVSMVELPLSPLKLRVFGWHKWIGITVFLAATANDVTQLPPELLRKGRFDEIFFIDLPDDGTRADIFRIHLGRRRFAPDKFDVAALAAAAEGFSGAEIEQAIVSAMYESHAAKRPLDSALVADELARTRPLSVVMAERVARLREWAAARTVPAA